MKTLEFLKANEPKVGDRMKLLSIDQIATRFGEEKHRMLKVDSYTRKQDNVYIVQETRDYYENTGLRLLLVQDELSGRTHLFYYPCEIDYIKDELEVELI